MFRRCPSPPAIALGLLLSAPTLALGQQAPDAPPDAPTATPINAPTSNGAPSPEQAARAAVDLDMGTVDQLTAIYVAGGMTSDQAAARAIEVGPTVQQAEAAVAIAEAGARQARLGFFPNLEASYRYTRLSNITMPDFGGFTFPVILNNQEFKATATLPVSDIFFTILPGYRSARSSVDAAAAQVEAENYNIALRARETYYEHVRALGSRIVAQQAIEQAEAQRAQVDALVSAGAAARVELYRVDAALARARVSLAQAELGVRTTEVALRALLDLDADADISVGEDLNAVPDRIEGTEESLTELALQNRAEIQALSSLVEAKRREIRSHGMGALPSIALQGNAIYSNPNQRIIPQQQEWNGTWDASLIVSWSPNQAARSTHNKRMAEAQLRQIDADFEQLRDAVRIEVAQSHHGYDAARAQLDAAHAGVEAAEESYRVRFAQLGAGAAVTRDLLDAQTDVNVARLELVNAVTEVRLARARLIHAVGSPE